VNCPQCGNPVGDAERFCAVCGKQLLAVPVVPGLSGSPGALQATSGKAIASLVLGLFFAFFPASILAIIFGHLSLSDIKKSGGRLTGQGLAIAGLVLGYMGIVMIPVILIVAAIAIPNLLRARISANEATAAGNVRLLTTAEITYSLAHPEEGFTCELGKLEAADPVVAMRLTGGRTHGYVFGVQDCEADNASGPMTKFQVTASPIVRNQTGVRTFCSDELGVIKFVKEGSVEDCITSGEPVGPRKIK